MTLSITNCIIGITALVSYLALNNRDLKYKLTFSPYSVKHHKRWWLAFTHAFVHADFGHLFLNMFVLYSFGNLMEGEFFRLWGPKGYLYFFLLYLGGIFFSTLPSFRKHGDNPGYLALGASGAVSAVLFTFIIFFPFESIYLLFIPIGIPAILFGVAYLAYENWASKNSRSNIGHDAHIAGALFGLLFILLVEPKVYMHLIEQIQSYFS